MNQISVSLHCIVLECLLFKNSVCIANFHSKQFFLQVKMSSCSMVSKFLIIEYFHSIKLKASPRTFALVKSINILLARNLLMEQFNKVTIFEIKKVNLVLGLGQNF